MNTGTTDALGIITVDYGKSLQDMIDACRYDWVNPDIAAKPFPVQGAGTKTFRTKLFDFGRDIWISSEDAVAAMKREKFDPATHIHGFAFGATFPKEQLKYSVACLGSSAEMSGHRRVVCFDGLDAFRRADLEFWASFWSDSWRLLGVQELSGT